MAGPILLCDDGSEAAGQAMRAAAPLLAGSDAIALHVWRPLSAGALLGAGAGLALPPDVDQEVAATAARTADQAADRARGSAPSRWPCRPSARYGRPCSTPRERETRR